MFNRKRIQKRFMLPIDLYKYDPVKFANIGTVLIHIKLFGNGKARPLKIKVTK